MKFHKWVFIFTIIGWCSALTLNLITVSRPDILVDYRLFVALLPGILVILSSLIHKALQLPDPQSPSLQNEEQNQLSLSRLFSHTPKWLIWLCVMGFGYVFVNFGSLILSPEGVPSIRNGEYVLAHRNKTIAVITATEYFQFKADQMRAFTSVPLAFYGLGIAGFFPFRRKGSEPLVGSST